MAKGFGGMPGGMNMNNLMKQAQKMQKQMEDMQAALAEESLEISSGGGAVTVTVGGDKRLRALVISPDVVDPDDVEMLQDLVLSAVNEALRQMDERVNEKMTKITGGMGGLPGMF